MNIKFKHGFTLLEMSISLLLIGIMFSLIGGWFTSSLKTSKAKENAGAISMPATQVINYINVNDEFPVIDNISTSEDIFDNKYDIFNDESYNALTDVNVCSLPTTTGLSINLYEDIDNTTYTTINNIALVVASKGLNGHADYSINADNDTLSLYSANSGTDDAFIYYTIAQLKAEFNCPSSAYATDFKFTNTSLLPANYTDPNAVYNRIYFTSGRGDYKVCYDDFENLSGSDGAYYDETNFNLMVNTSTSQTEAGMRSHRVSECSAGTTSTPNAYVYMLLPSTTPPEIMPSGGFVPGLDRAYSAVKFTLKVTDVNGTTIEQLFTHQVFEK